MSCFSHKFQLGPQLFDNSENRGVRRAYLPPPRKEQFELGSTYSDIIKRGRLLFFPDAALKPDKCFWLTDSSGQPLPHFGPNTDLRTYLRMATPQLSKLRVYVVYSPSEEVRFYILTCQLQMLSLTHLLFIMQGP